MLAIKKHWGSERMDNNITVTDNSCVKNNNISFPMLFLLLFMQFANVYIGWIGLVVVSLFLIFIKGRGRFSFNMPGFFPYLFLIVEGIIVGLIHIDGNGWWPYLRDIIRLSNVIFCWFVFQTISKNSRRSKASFYRSFYLFCFCCSLIQLIRFAVALGTSLDLYSLRTTVLINEGVFALGTFLSFFKPTELGDSYYFGKIKDIFASIVIVITSFLTFSRIVYLLVLILLLCNIRNFKKFLGFTAIAALAFGAIYLIIPDFVGEFIEKIAYSFNEISSDNTWNDSTIVNNWRGYEAYNFSLWYQESGFAGKIFGGGFGTTLDVGEEYAHIVTGEDTLGYLHNAYLTFIMKNGILGLCCIALFCLCMFCRILKDKNQNEKRMLIGLFIGIMVTAYFAISVFWSGKDMFILCFIAYLLACKESNYE